MWLRTSCDITFDVNVPTPFILMLRPQSEAQQWVAHEDCTSTPSVEVTEHADSYGNLCERLIAPPGEFSIRRSADVSIADGIDVSPWSAIRGGAQSAVRGSKPIFFPAVIASPTGLWTSVGNS